MKKILFIVLSVLILGGAGFVYFKYYFVFGSGIKTGTLNYVVHKGYVFKTYEGEMILSGVSSKTPGTIQSNQFLFSVDNEEVAKKLERMGLQARNQAEHYSLAHFAESALEVYQRTIKEYKNRKNVTTTIFRFFKKGKEE